MTDLSNLAEPGTVHAPPGQVVPSVADERPAPSPQDTEAVSTGQITQTAAVQPPGLAGSQGPTPQQQVQQAETTPAATELGLKPTAHVSDVAQKVSQAIALGLEPTPTTPQGWRALADKYSNPAGGSPGVNEAPPGAAPVDTGKTVMGSSGLNSFMAAIRAKESGGNYDWNLTSPTGARGAYQFEPGTWASAAAEAGVNPGDHSPAAQDTVAAHLMQSYFQQFGSWQSVAKAWYGGPGYAEQNQQSGQAGGFPSIDQYASDVVGRMAASAAPQPGSQEDFQVHPVVSGPVTALSYARSVLGTPYVWGGSTLAGFDCSGLVQAAYAKAGVALPRTAQEQYDSTAKLPPGAKLQPGDLVFMGSSPADIGHVGIYIGNNQMIDAPHSGAQVRIEDYRWGDYVGATRPSDPTGISALPQTSQSAGAVTQQAVLGHYNQILQMANIALMEAGVR